MSAQITVHLKILEIGSQKETLEGKPRSYRIHPMHLCNPSNVVIKERCLDDTIVENIKEAKLTALKKRIEKRTDTLKDPVQLYSFYYVDTMRVDRQKAMAFWQGWLDEQLAALNPDAPSYKQEISVVYMKYFSAVVALNRIEDNDRF